MQRLLFFALLFAITAPVGLSQEWGTIRGQFVYDGAVPDPTLLHKKGADIKDKEVCAATDTFANDLLVDSETKGIANVFIYLRKAPKAVHPDLAEPESDTVTFDQKGCMFTPHCMLVRAGQTVKVLSDDGVPHNTHTNTLKNQQENLLIPPNEREGIPIETQVAEIVPSLVNCDYHKWMTAYWLILDHPYMAVTDKEGRFEIKGLPAGEHEFRVWHERAGYVDRAFKVVVKGGDEPQDVDPVKVDPDKLKKED